MIARPSSALRLSLVVLSSCLVTPLALVSCHRAEPNATTENPPSPPQAIPAASPTEGTLTNTMPPEEVFKRALWRRPAPDDKILHAERREWTNDSTHSVAHWQWFLAIEPGEALKKWLREQNPFSVHPVGNAEAPEIKDAPPWFPADNSSCIVHTGGSAANLVFLWSRKGNTLYATASGTGFQPGAPEPAPPATTTPSAPDGRLPQSSPPTSPTP
jgi:hypothetical protein